jgi:hypothetical protein
MTEGAAWGGSLLAASSSVCYGARASMERYRVGDMRYRCRMPRSQVGLRISQQALTRIDTLANEYDTTRAATVRALLSEALASEPVVAATRRRLRLTLG